MLDAISTESPPTLAFVAKVKRRAGPPGGEVFGKRLRRLRLAKGLTQAELGRLVGLSNRMVAYYEIQGGEPRPELMMKLAEVLGVSLDILMGRSETAKREGRESPDNLRLWRRLKRIEELPAHDRKTILKMIDAMADQAGKRKVG